MKEEWLKDIHNQMADYEADEPKGLWESIQAKRLEENKKRHRKVIMLWAKRFVASVAIVALLFTIGYLLDEEEKSPTPTITHIPIKKNDNGNDNILKSKSIQEENKTITNRIEQKKSEIQDVLTRRKQGIQTKREPHLQTETVANVEKAQVINKFTLKEIIDTKNPLEVVQQQKYFQQGEKKKLLFEEITQTKTSQSASKHLTFSLFTSAGTGASLNNSSVNEPPIYVDEPSSSEPEWIENGLLRTLATTKSTKEGTSTNYRLPIRTGVLFSYHLSDRFALESGVTYTNLISDKREGNEVLYSTSEQELHFVGVPLNVKYRVFEWQGLEFYGLSGVLAEKNVSGKQIRTYFFENQITQTESETFKLKSWQWSTNVAFGLQYRFSPWLGFYAEPGVSYYFNNGSSVETIYKSKPFNFNLNLGVRFSFGK